MTTAEQVLAKARSQLGTAESPAGSNDVEYNTWYYGREVSGPDFPWCAVFQSWVAAMSDAAQIIPRHAYTPAGAGWFQSNHQWSRTPKVGSLVYYQRPGMNRICHVGIVEAVNADGSWIAIEGNTDGGGSHTGGIVMRQRRSSVGQLGGFGHPAYDADGIAVQAFPVPEFPPFAGVLLRLGSTGDDVTIAQRGLNRHVARLGLANLDEDGDFGPLTETTALAYQTDRHGQPFNLEIDGVVGPETWKSLPL